MDNFYDDLASINHEKAIARFLGIELKELEKSTKTGRLFGVTAPKHFMIGRVRFYKKSDFEVWLGNFADAQGDGL